MKVLVLGGSGSIGSAILSALLARGHEVIALARSEASAGRVAGLGASPLAGDIRAPEPWSGVLTEVDAVVHAAATFVPDMGRVDRRLIEALLDRLGTRERQARLLYTGGCWLYGQTGDLVADESAPFDPPADFAWMVENARRVLGAGQVQAIVIHPAMVYDREGGVFARFIDEAKRGGPVRVVGSEAVRWPLVQRDDLAQLYVLALERGIAGASYNGAAVEGLAVGRIARAMARRYGVPEDPEVIPVAQIVAELGSSAEGTALDQQMSGAKARAELGWSPQHLDPLA